MVALEAVFAEVDIISKRVFATLELSCIKPWVTVKFRLQDFESLRGWIFFELSNLLSVFLFGIRFIKNAKLLTAQAEASKTIFALYAVDAKI